MTANQMSQVEHPLTLAEIRIRDPFVIESPPGRFVLFGTTDENVWGGPATGFDCYTSADLELWSGPIAAFRPPAGFWADTQFWAPEVHELGGRFFLVGSFATSSGSAARGVAILVADQPTGPFVPWSDGPVTPSDQSCLDGTLFTDGDGVHWLVYSRSGEGAPHEAAGIADGEMYAMQLTDDLRRPAGEPVLLFSASAAAWSRPLHFPGGTPPKELRLPKDPLFTDGPFVVRSTGNTLLMLWSSFGTRGYAMGIARSTNGTITGPWVQSAEPLWAENGGHGMVLRTSAGTDHLVFHWPNDSPDERVRLVDLAIDADKMTLSGQTPPR